MALSPTISQGTINRIRGSVIVPGLPNLNITAPYLGKMGIRVAFDGNATVMIDTMTGMVTSPEPFLAANVTVHLLRTQNLGLLWRQQMESQTSAIGDITVTSDSSIWTDYDFQNTAITAVHEVPFDGTDPGYVIVIRGTYQINAQLYNIF